MPRRGGATPPNLGPLPSRLLSQRADRRSEQTVKDYADGVRFFPRWCERVQVDPLARGSLRGWVTELMDGGNRPATARARQLAVRRFTAWLTDEGVLRPAGPDHPWPDEISSRFGSSKKKVALTKGDPVVVAEVLADSALQAGIRHPVRFVRHRPDLSVEDLAERS